MEPEPFDDHKVSNRPPDAGQGSSDTWLTIGQHKAQAVMDLIRNKVLSHTFGEQGEYEVRTTFETRQAWRYRCSVLRRGRVLKKVFPPITLDQTHDMEKAGVVTEEMRAAFAEEAVDIHFTRCGVVKEYLVLAAIFSEPPPRDYRLLRLTRVIFMCAALAAAYWFWKPAIHLPLNSAPVKAPPHLVQWERKEIFYTYLAGTPFSFPLPALNGTATNSAVEVSMDSSDRRPSWLHFHRDTLRISGVAPMTEEDRTYQLVFFAKADGSQESRLHVYLTIAGQKASPQAALLRSSMASSPAPHHQDGGVERQFPPGPSFVFPSPDPLRDNGCLIKILKGESC
jgi:Putative Ig domain